MQGDENEPAGINEMQGNEDQPAVMNEVQGNEDEPAGMNEMHRHWLRIQRMPPGSRTSSLREFAVRWGKDKALLLAQIESRRQFSKVSEFEYEAVVAKKGRAFFEERLKEMSEETPAS